VTSFRLTRNWQEADKLATDLVSFTRAAKCIFPTNYPLHHLHCYHFWDLEHAWLKKKNGSTYGQNPLDAMTSQKRGMAAEYC